MSNESENLNKDLYDVLKVRGYDPVPLSAQNQRIPVVQEADVIQFQFNKDGEDFGKCWVSVKDADSLVLYYDKEQQDSPESSSSGLDYDDSWTGFIKFLKIWAQRRQLGFDLMNKDRLDDDMKQREYYKQKSRLGEAYHPISKKSSYNDSVPNVKIILQHSRNLEEGEQRYRNISKIYLENTEGERFLAPTNKPGLAQIYARHIAEGGLPNDERWNHLKEMCEDYGKMAGFVRATKNRVFEGESETLINDGKSYYTGLRETLGRLKGPKGYHSYFENWQPEPEMDGESDLGNLFVQETLDPRIESVMPILSRLSGKKKNETDELEAWAESVVAGDIALEEIEQIDELSHETLKSYRDKALSNRKDNIKIELDKLEPMSVRNAASKTQRKRARGIANAEKSNRLGKDWGEHDDNEWVVRDAMAGLTENEELSERVKSRVNVGNIVEPLNFSDNSAADFGSILAKLDDIARD